MFYNVEIFIPSFIYLIMISKMSLENTTLTHTSFLAFMRTQLQYHMNPISLLSRIGRPFVPTGSTLMRTHLVLREACLLFKLIQTPRLPLILHLRHHCQRRVGFPGLGTLSLFVPFSTSTFSQYSPQELQCSEFPDEAIFLRIMQDRSSIFWKMTLFSKFFEVTLTQSVA